MVETIAIIAGVISGLGVILGTLWKVHKFLDRLEDKYNEMNETLKQNTLYILKMAVTDKEMPLVERIHAGEEYLDLGGNGTIKKKYKHLLEEYEAREEEHMQ